jgi:kinetochore protein Mis13/DSN1
VPDKPLVVPKRRGLRRTRSPPPAEDIAEEEPAPEPAPAPPSSSAVRSNGARQASKDDGAKQSARKKTQKPSAPPLEDESSQATPEQIDKALERDPNAQKIALPFSDTPINARNQAFRKKGGAGAGGGRRSSVGLRGKRASSLIENGYSAIPHREVSASEFFKHIESEGLSEPRRMKQLLTWCGERALSEKPKHGTAGAPAVLGARAIQDALLKDFGSKSEFSDWFSREDEPSAVAAPKRPVVIKPNPVNVEHEEKIAALEARIKRWVGARGLDEQRILCKC